MCYAKRLRAFSCICTIITTRKRFMPLIYYIPRRDAATGEITSVVDTSFNQTSLLISSNVALQSFSMDASNFANEIIVAGDARASRYTPYLPSWSVFLDGSGDYLTYTGGSSINFGTSDFTIELWVNLKNNNTYVPFLRPDDSGAFAEFGYDFSSSLLKFNSRNLTIAEISAVMPTDQWVHVAASSTRHSLRLFLNGIQVGSTLTNSTNFASTSGTIRIGGSSFSASHVASGYISNLRVVKGTAVYTANFIPPTAPLTAIAGTSLLTLQDNRFIDESPSNFAITKFGDTVVSPFNPFTAGTVTTPTTYSTYFDGSTGYLTISNVPSPGTGDFTWEFWVYTTRNNVVQLLVSTPWPSPGWQIFINTSGKIEWQIYSTSPARASTPSVQINKWTHIAWTRQSGTMRLFIDGVLDTVDASINNNVGTLNTFYIGARAGTAPLLGYLSNVRLLSGQALYTSNFTPSTSPLTAIAGTSLLTCQNATLIDNSTNNFTITSFGQAQPNILNPFGSSSTTNNIVTTPTTYSTYFDGTGDYLTVPATNQFNFGTGDFTIEFWVYPNAYGGTVAGAQLFGTVNGSTSGYSINLGESSTRFRIISNATGSWADTLVAGTGPALNTWSHIAVSRSGANISIFVNGTRAATSASASTWNFSGTTGVIGRFFEGTTTREYNGSISNLRVVKGTAVYNPTQATITVPTSLLTAITNTSLLTCQNATLIDNSTNNFTITSFGQAQPSPINPFGSSSSSYSSTYSSALTTPNTYSNYFDGSGDYLSVPDNVALNFGTENFTIECWVNPSQIAANYPTFFGSATGWVSGSSSHRFNNIGYANKFWFGLNGSGGVSNGDPFIVSTNTFSFNNWYHYAVTRSGNTWRMFVNGTLESTQTFSGSYLMLGGSRVGWAPWDGNNGYFFGSVSNLRVVKGTALYTSNFTPPTTPLTAISGTSLLTCQNSTFIDNSTNNFTITVTGNTTISRANPFGFTSAGTTTLTRGSAYFDGTGDYLSIPASAEFVFAGNYTVEFWVYFNNITGTQDLVGNYVSSTAADWTIILNSSTIQYYPSSAATLVQSPTVVAGTWYHVAAVRNGTTCSLYLNGVLVGTSLTFSGTLGSAAKPLYIGTRTATGNYLNGYMSNLRIVKGTAVYTSNFLPPTEPLTAITNTVLLTCQNSNPHNNHTFVNSATGTSNLVLTRSGNATQTSISPYAASWGGYFASSQYISTPASSEFAFGTGDFTVECWLNPLAQTGVNIIQSSASNSWGLITFGSQIGWQQNAGNFGSGVGTVPLNTWSHIAVTRSSGTLRRFLNGVLLESATDNFNYTGTSGRQIGHTGGGAPFWLSNVRIVKGTALYTANFTPSTSPLTAVSGTSLLTLQNDQFIDNSSNKFALTATGTPTPSLNNNTQFALNTLPTPTTYSGYFDGSGDYISVPTTSGALNQTGDFTYEMWIYWNSMPTAGYQNIAGQGAGGQSSYGLYTGNTAANTWSAPYVFKLNIANSGDVLVGNTTLVAGRWYHLAHTRTSGVNRLFVDGVVQTNTYNDSTSRGFNSNPYQIGNSSNCYISNFRFVQGSSLYTTSFTPSTSPLTAISGTSLLTCQNSTFIDNSTNNSTITSFGQAKPSAINPFGSTSATADGYSVAKFKGSAYFDGTTDFLTVSTSLMFNLLGNFTIEAWVYPTALITNSWAIIDARVNGQTAQPWAMGLANSSGYKLELYTGTALRGTTTIPLNTWTHVAWVRSGSALSSYVNGVRDYHNASFGTAAISPGSTSARIGSKDNNLAGYETQGYISDLRFANGTAIYTSNFLPSSVPLTPTSNTVLMLDCSAGAIVDATGKNPIETVGDARISNKAVKYGTTAMYFDGTGDYLLIPSSTDLELGSSNFTIEAWVYPIVGGSIYGKRPSSAGWGGFALSIDPSTRNVWFLADNDTSGPWAVQMTGSTVSLNTWSHIAVTRSGSTWTIWLNGVQSATATSSITVNTSSTSVSVGALSNGDARLTGYISDLRFTKGTARYTTNFTPPTAELPKL